MKKIKAFAIVTFIWLQTVCYSQQWPEVTPISGEMVFLNPETAEFHIVVKDIRSHPIYVLSCKSGELEDNDFNFSGLFHCRMVSLYSKENVSSLLTENLHQTSDWEGRSRFLLNQVIGHCAEMVDWGAERTFVLRGMRIILSVKEVNLSGCPEHPKVNSFKFAYSIKPDNRAVSSIALKSPMKEPEWFGTGDYCVKEALGKLQSRKNGVEK
jgi:hypothetical protein